MKKMSYFLLPTVVSGLAKARRRKSGAILFLAIAAISVLSILAVGTARGVLHEQKLARRVTEANVSYYAASSVAHAMKFIFASKKTPGAVSLDDLRSCTVAMGNVSVRVRFYDEQGKINIFVPRSPDVLKRLPGLEFRPKLVKAIQSMPRVPTSVKEDLLLCKGMTFEIYNQLKDRVTVFGLGGVNMNTASRDTLEMLGVDPELISRIISLREHIKPEDLVKALESSILSASEKAALGLWIGFGRLKIETGYVSMEMDVVSKERELHSYALVLTTYPPGLIISWREH